MARDFGDVAQRLPHEHAAVQVMLLPQAAIKLGALVRGELAHGGALQNFRFDWGQGQKHGGKFCLRLEKVPSNLILPMPAISTRSQVKQPLRNSSPRWGICPRPAASP